MLKEIDSIPEIMFYVSNIGIIFIGFYFLVVSRTIFSKLFLSSPAILLYIITPMVFISGCKLDWLSSVTCREWFWIYVLFPPPVFVISLVELFVYKYFIKRHT